MRKWLTLKPLFTRNTTAPKPLIPAHHRPHSSSLACGSIDVQAMADQGTSDGHDEGLEPEAADSSEQVTGQSEGSGIAPVLALTPGVADVAPPQKNPPVRKRRPKPALDLDEHIHAAQEAMKAARKQVQLARAQAKLEKRKKQRLVRKASSLNVEDLERIAVLKRCALLTETTPQGGKASASSSRGSASSAGKSNPPGDLQA